MTGLVTPTKFHMETASGVYFDLSAPDPSMVRLADVAHHLAQENRYTGAAGRPISVAEHAVLVADRVRHLGYGPQTILAALHHDDHEAYTGDIGRPVKLLLKARAPGVIEELEQQVQDAIVVALNLPVVTGRLAESVRIADEWALSAEAYFQMRSCGRGWVSDGLFDPADVPPPPRTYGLRGDMSEHWTIHMNRWLIEHYKWMAAWKAGEARAA